jgi:hypothetical protein
MLMKKIILFVLVYCIIIPSSFAVSNVLGISDSKLRNGNVDINDIPVAINSLIYFFMGIAGTISVIFVII